MPETNQSDNPEINPIPDNNPGTNAPQSPEDPSSAFPMTASVHPRPENESPENVLTNSKKPKHKKLRIIVWAVGVLLGVAVILGIYLLNHFALMPASYDNGKGSRYSIDFYSKPYSEPLETSLVQGSKNSETEGLNVLYSNAPLLGSPPLGVWAITKPVPNDYENLAKCTAPSFVTHNAFTNSDVTTCIVRPKGRDVMYLTHIRDGDRYHMLVFIQRIDLASPKPIESYDLSSYRSDIQEMIKSFRPL